MCADDLGSVDPEPTALPDPADEAPLDDLTAEGLARTKAAHARARAGRRAETRGLVIVNTGKGKGKTTAALGLLLRAWGRGLRVAMFQFIKSKTGRWGENRAARRLGITMTPLGDGFTWQSKDIEHDRALARAGWEQCVVAMVEGQYDVVVLDELTYCLKFGWLPAEEVLDALRRRPPAMHVVITGRDAPDWLVEYADLVTEMVEVKHPLKSGLRAQPGIEF